MSREANIEETQRLWRMAKAVLTESANSTPEALVRRLRRCTPAQAHAATILRESAEQLLDVAMTIATTGETEACDWIIADAELTRAHRLVKKCLAKLPEHEPMDCANIGTVG